MKLKKEDFNAGSPFSCWLKEELIGEIVDFKRGFETRGLVEKYRVHVDDYTVDVVMHIKKLDDLPDDLKKVAIDIIRMEWDEDFSG